MADEGSAHETRGATPLTVDDVAGLIPKWVADRDDLNLAEARNIADARAVYLAKKLTIEDILDDLFVRRLHFGMFGAVWAWAGTYRLLETSIGAPPERIPIEVVNLMGDARYWLNSDDPNDIDVAVCQVHHRLVLIHPFRNGNGRMTRFFADLLLVSKGRPPFTWGTGPDLTAGAARAAYIEALRAADSGDVSALIAFVRSQGETPCDSA